MQLVYVSKTVSTVSGWVHVCVNTNLVKRWQILGVHNFLLNNKKQQKPEYFFLRLIPKLNLPKDLLYPQPKFKQQKKWNKEKN